MKSQKISISLEVGLLILFVFINLIIHLLTNIFAGYGIYRDELYYLACSSRLALGYVDQPPFSIYVLTLLKFLIGDSVFAIRLLPAILSSLTVLFAGLMTRKLGGGIAAVVITGMTIIVTPIYLAMNSYYSMNSFDIFFWALAAYVLVLIMKDGKQKHWLTLGIITGLGLLNKISMAWFVIGLFVALLVTKHRKQLLTKWPYLAGIIAFILFTPFIIWNVTHNMAHLEFMRNAIMYKYSGITRVDFVLGQFLLMNPAAVPVWLAGLFYFFINKKGRMFNILGIIFVVTFFILFINGHSKPEYLSPAYIPLFAAGGVQLEQLARRKYWGWIKIFVPAQIVLIGILIAPLALPVLPVETFISFNKTLRLQPPAVENKELADLPQHYADMFGWENLAQSVSDVYTSLPQEGRSKAVIFTQNYGEAGAIEYFSKKFDLPPVICPHNSYWFWSRDILNNNYRVVIIVGGQREDHLKALEQVEQVAVIQNKYSMPYENNLPVYIGKNLKIPLQDIWEAEKSFN